MLKFGDKGDEVIALQRLMNVFGFNLVVDGIYGVKTEEAVKMLQKCTGLVVDGAVGVKSDAALHKKDIAKYLKENDIEEAAQLLSVDIATVKAVNKVESNGSGFLSDGRPKILYERHIFYREYSAENKGKNELVLKWAQKRPDICSKSRGGYRGGAAEWGRYASAEAINPVCAKKSTSWGLFQILGCNFKSAGFGTVDEFVDAMRITERQHLLAFVHFIMADKKMWDALKKQDWATFACRYNGPAYKRNNYDDKLKNAYRHFAEMAPV